MTTRTSINFTQEEKAKGYDLLLSGDFVDFLSWFKEHPAYVVIVASDACLKTLGQVSKTKDPKTVERFWRIVVEMDWDAQRRTAKFRAQVLLFVLLGVLLLAGYGVFKIFE